MRRQRSWLSFRMHIAYSSEKAWKKSIKVTKDLFERYEVK